MIRGTVGPGFTGGRTDPPFQVKPTPFLSVRGIYTGVRVPPPPGGCRSPEGAVLLSSPPRPPSRSHPSRECGQAQGCARFPFLTFPDPDSPRQPSSILLQTNATMLFVRPRLVTSPGPWAGGRGQGEATVPSAPRRKRLGGWNSFPVPATLLWLSAGKSGTSQPPSGNRGDTNRSFKTQNIWSVTFSVWANRALLIKPRQIPAEAKVDLTVLGRRVRHGLQLG